MLADGPEEIRKGVRRLLREGADQIKIWASGGDNWANDRNCDQHYTFDEIRMAVIEAHMQRGTLVLSHAENRDSIRDVASYAGVDTIEHGEDLDEELCEEMVRRGTILVPTLELLTTWFVAFMPADSPVEHIRPEVFLQQGCRRGA